MEWHPITHSLLKTPTKDYNFFWSFSSACKLQLSKHGPWRSRAFTQSMISDRPSYFVERLLFFFFLWRKWIGLVIAVLWLRSVMSTSSNNVIPWSIRMNESVECRIWCSGSLFLPSFDFVPELSESSVCCTHLRLDNFCLWRCCVFCRWREEYYWKESCY